MERLVKTALANGYSRAQAYEIWNRAVELKKLKVFGHLKLFCNKAADWSEIEGKARKSCLTQEQYLALRRIYFSY